MKVRRKTMASLAAALLGSGLAGLGLGVRRRKYARTEKESSYEWNR